MPNYRDISILDVLSKLPEKQVYIKISGIISTYIAQWQYGFLPGRSTMSQLSQVVHQFARALEMRQQIVVIYLDFAEWPGLSQRLSPSRLNTTGSENLNLPPTFSFPCLVNNREQVLFWGAIKDTFTEKLKVKT